MSRYPRLPDAILRDQQQTESPTAEATLLRQKVTSADGALVPVVYGVQRVGAAVFAVATKVDDDGYHILQGCLWCHGPIEDILFIERDLSQFQPFLPGTATPYQTDYLGSPTQTADPWLAALIPRYADTLVANLGGRSVPVAYSVIGTWAEYNESGGFPEWSAVLKGRTLYDPRTGLTAYSNNAALALADWITNPDYGQGLDIDWASVEAAADYCDEALGSGVRRSLNLMIDAELPVAQWTDILATYAGCWVVHAGDKVKLVPDGPTTATRALTAADYVEDTFTLRRLPLSDRPTVVEVAYTDTTVTPYREARVAATLAAVDAGTLPRRVEVVTLPGISYRTQAYREAVERLNYHTLTDLEATWVTFDAGLQDQVGDVVTVTHPVGLTAEPFRILDVQMTEPGRWRVLARNYDAAVYSDAIIAPDDADYTDLPDPGDLPTMTGLTAASGNSHLLQQTDGSITSRILVSWTAPTYHYLRGVEVEFRRSGDTVWTSAGVATGTSAYCAPVEDGIEYDLRIRAVSTVGTTGDWTASSHTVVGKTEAPPDVTTFTVTALADGTRILSWTLTAPPADLAGYQVRYVSGSSGTWASMTAMHTGLLTSSPVETNALAAGEWTFAIKAVDTSGNESATAIYITTTLPDPRLANVLEYVDCYEAGWSGTKTNCWVDTDGILYAKDTNTWASLSGSTWAAWTAGWTQDALDMTYTHGTIDVGVITTFTPLVSAIAPEGTLLLEERVSDDNSTWSSWATCGNAPLSGRYYEARAKVSGSAGDQLRLAGMVIVIDADELEETIEDLATSTLSGSYDLGVGDVRLPITKTYATIRSVFITLQSTGAGWSWELIDKDTSVGPRIKIYNSSNTLADATIDALIRGL